VEGLAGATYFDKVAPTAFRVQSGPVAFTGETDRVYASSTPCTILDPTAGRRIAITTSGNRATVVWNPWIAKAKAMADFGDDQWPEMVCVETANCLDVPVTLLPGTAHATVATYAVIK
jgi:glucose-6-phosphate 1-epimerase